jgi:hypothetical protein
MERMRCTGFYSDRPLPVQLIGFPPLSFRAKREILYSGAVLEDFSLTVEMTRGVAGGAINEKYSNPPCHFEQGEKSCATGVAQ